VSDGGTDGPLAFLDGATLWRTIENAADQAKIGVYVAHSDAQTPRILYVNQHAASILGRPASELIGALPWSMLRDDDIATVRAAVERPAGAPPVVLELSVHRPDGTQVPITLAATRVQSSLGTLSFGYFRDISHERETLDALRRSEARFRFLVEAAPDGVVILQRGAIVFMNPRAAQLLGVTIAEAHGKPIAAFLPPADAATAGERIGAMLRNGVEFPPSEYGVLADPARVVEIKSIVCEWNGAQAVLAFARDVTERKAIQRRLVESDRLAALGTLAAGVAHEINNPLTYVQLSAERIARVVEGVALPEDVRDQLLDSLDDIRHGIRRVAAITQQLHSFVSHDDNVVEPVDVEQVLARALKMVDNELRHVAQLAQTIQPAPPVLGNASRLEQVFVNVLINAIKALPFSATRPHEIRVGVHHAGDRVTVTIEDTGIGISEPVRSRIFDPFFTTRDIGHGMGLGLSVSKTIVENYGGEIEVDSTENVGTTVRVHLKRHIGPSAATPEPAPRAPATRRRILVVDDEPMICQILHRILRDDHDVTIAENGNDALAALRESLFDLILCDVMMPGMNADELIRRIATERPGLQQRFVFMSGGAIGSEVEDMLEGLPNLRLAKPFRVEDVLAVVDRLA
jgi:PAS domain S-box-containing protein